MTWADRDKAYLAKSDAEKMRDSLASSGLGIVGNGVFVCVGGWWGGGGGGLIAAKS